MTAVVAGIAIILIVAVLVRIVDIAQTTTRRRIAIERRESWEARYPEDPRDQTSTRSAAGRTETLIG